MSKIQIHKLPKSKLEIESEIETDVFESFYAPALKKLGEHAEIPGFRKGKVPENILISHLSEAKILEEMAELALSEHYPKILEENKIDALNLIGRPEIAITKLARRNPLGFKIIATVLPEFKLPNYKKIAQKVLKDAPETDKNVIVTEEDLDSTILDIRKSRAPKVHMATEPLLDKEREPKAGEVDLPEFTDDFVRSLGPFKDVADFREKLKENLHLEKQNAARERTRLKIAEEIVAKTEIDLPEILVDIELDKIIYRMESDISAMGLKFEDYLTHLKKTREDLRKDFRKDAEVKAKLALILNEIAKTEKIQADPKDVEREVAAILEHYKEADPERARMHAENVLVNEKIFQFLENQAA